MKRRRLERITVLALSGALLLSSTGVFPSLAANVSESTSAPISVSTETTTASHTTTTSAFETTTSAPTTTVAVKPESDAVLGSSTNPYKIASAADLIAMSAKINDETNANKCFLLTSDIDLSSVKASDLVNGSLVSSSKSTSKNVFFILEGNGHKITGLNISTASNVSIFGFINSRSAIQNLTIINPSINVTSASVGSAAVLAAENEGTISNVVIENPVLTFGNATNAGIAVAVNNGTLSNIKVNGKQNNLSYATAELHTIYGAGNIGGVVGTNSGKISSVSALNIGACLSGSSPTLYGGIVGSNNGSVSNSVSTGNVAGGSNKDCAAGVIGKAGDKTSLSNIYTLVGMNAKSANRAVIASGGNSAMVADCYWSSEISKCDFTVGEYGFGVNDINKSYFKIVALNENVVLSSADARATWGKASLVLSGGFTGSGSGIAVTSADGATVLKGTAVDTVNQFKYNMAVTLPSSVGYGTDSVKFTQKMGVTVLVTPTDAKSNGTAASPFVIKNTAELKSIANIQGIYAKVDKNFTASFSAFKFKGNLDGNGHTVTVTNPMFSAVFGSVKNMSVVVKANVSTAIFGNAYGANISGVNVSAGEGNKFDIKSNNVGYLFNVVSGETSIDNTNVKANAEISADTNSAGILAGEIKGDKTSVVNSGVCGNITIKDGVKAANIANLIGSVTGKNIVVSNSYVSGKNSAGQASFAGQLANNTVSFRNNYFTNGAQSAVDFVKYGFVDKKQFTEWKFGDDNIAFFTGNGGSFKISKPAIKAITLAKADDFKITCDNSKLVATVNVENDGIVLNVSRAKGVVTVKAVPVTVTNKTTGMSVTLIISNGLEKTADGKYLLTSAYDFAYLSENVDELKSDSFIVNSDIDMSVISSFKPIGSVGAAFGGKIDGKGHKVSNLKISSGAMAGLFGIVDGATISNLVIDKATVDSKGSYAAVLVGSAKNSTIESVTVKNSKVKVADVNSSIVCGFADGGTIKNITVSDSTIDSTANYVGAIVGHASGNVSITNAQVNKYIANGANFVSGIAGTCNGKVTITESSVTNSKINGTSEVSGIASGTSVDSSISNVSVKSTEITTIATTSANTAGGIASSFAASINNAVVESSKINAGIAGGIVGRAAENCKLIINNSDVKATTIFANGANTVAAGILAVYNTKGSATVSGCAIDSDSVIESAALTGGIVGDFLNNGGNLCVTDSVMLGTVKGCESADAISAGGAVGRIGISSINHIKVSKVNITGNISGCGAIGGLVGLIKDGEEFSSASPMASDCVVAVSITASDRATEENVGVVFGSVSHGKAVNKNNIDSVISNVIVSTYFGSVLAFSESSGITSTKVIDLDKPNGKGIESSVPTLTTSAETEITIKNVPSIRGFVFDSETGWISESADRITVVSSSETSAILKANHMADISVVGYYVLESDSRVRVPVHFQMKSTMRTPLKGQGTASDPYLVSNAYDLETVSQYDSEGKVFVLSKDIQFKADDFQFGGAFYNVGNGIVTIGSAENGFKGTFTGRYNGTVHTINGLRLSGNTFGGLFGATDGATIIDLIIDDADVTGKNYAGVIVGSAVNTTIKNVTIKSVKVSTTEFGGYTGAVVGYADNTTLENVKVNDATVETTVVATSATTEVAGGFAAVFNGVIKNCSLENVKITSGTVAGGVIGDAKSNDKSVNVAKVSADVQVNAKVSGGIIGSVSNPTKTTISDTRLNGNVNGTEVSGGAFGEIKDGKSLNKAEESLLKNVLVACKVNGSDVCGSIVGKASVSTFVDAENKLTEVFSNVYYSSYQNSSKVFGDAELNSLQTDEYKVYDVNEISYVSGENEFDSIQFTSNSISLADNSISVKNGDGNFKSFTVAGFKSNLKDITSNVDGLVSYDKTKSELTLNKVADENTTIEFVYDSGLVLALGVSQSNALIGDGTQSNPYLISNATEFELMMQSNKKDTYYLLKNDISLKGVSAAEEFAGILDGNGKVVYDFTGNSLFEIVSGKISNLGLAGFKITSLSDASLGALAGVLDGATISNTFVIADVSAGKNVQDTGILAGRMINGTTVDGVITSGRVVSDNALSVGGIVGASVNSKINASTSTAYAKASSVVGGIIGNAEYTTVTNVIFANMVESKTANKAGNIIGKIDTNSTVDKAYFDKSTAKISDAFGTSTDKYSAEGLATEKLVSTRVSGFVTTSEYSVPSGMKNSSYSDMFKAGYTFASLTIKYVVGLNAGTALNYTDVNVSSKAMNSVVSVDKTSGIKLTLGKNAEFADSSNSIERFANPSVLSPTKMNYSIVDSTKNASLSDKLIGVLLKSKLDGKSNSFSFFTRPGDDESRIDNNVVTDGGVYVDLALPLGYTFTVSAVNGNGNALGVTDAGNDGYLVETGSADNVELVITVKNAEIPWGLQSIWSAIGK